MILNVIESLLYNRRKNDAKQIKYLAIETKFGLIFNNMKTGVTIAEKYLPKYWKKYQFKINGYTEYCLSPVPILKLSIFK